MSRGLACEKAGCSESYLVERDRLEKDRQLEGDGQQHEAQARPTGLCGTCGRDRPAEDYKILGFEMEVPSVVVKGVCDYANSHKNGRVAQLCGGNGRRHDQDPAGTVYQDGQARAAQRSGRGVGEETP
ncbi:hypothetical protein LZ30DRAFT_688375 [Colletotrichum cereale]|nr:hypothetical protein LZ30DRAFT_688375 [Colletotrichum cereale]